MAFPSLNHRHRQPELMDAPDADPALLAKSLAFIRRVNLLLGYTRATLTHLERFSKRWPPGKTVRILDIATGSADIPRAIVKWADRRGLDVQVVAFDLHEATVAAAQAAANHPRIQLLRADALALPFETGSFDYALTSMFLHHLDDDQIVTVLMEMNRVASRGIIVADLLRNRRAYGWIQLFTACSNPMVRHDARVSVQQAFTQAEIIALRDRAKVGYADYVQHFAHRFVLAGEKPGDA